MSDVAIDVNSAVHAFSLSWSKSVCNPKTGTTRIRGPRKTMIPFKCENVELAGLHLSPPRQAPRFLCGWLEIFVSPG